MDATKSHRWAWLLPFVALAIGYAVGYARRDATSMFANEPAASPKSTAASAHRRTQTTQSAVAASPASTNLPPMPVDHAPLSQSFDALAARARNGDGHAASRLLDETTHCAQRQREVESLAHEVAVRIPNNPDLEQKFHDEAVAHRAKAEADVAATRDLCAGVDDDEIATKGEWLQRAAADGDPAAEACYALAEDSFAPAKFSDGWIDWARDYRLQATSYAERAFAAGYAQAAWYLFDVYAGRYAVMTYGRQSQTTPDLERAYALALFQAARLQASSMNISPVDVAAWTDRATMMESELSPTQVAQARAWADTEIARLGNAEPPALPCHGVTTP